MRINSKGQVTIPADLRARHGLHEGDQVEVRDREGVLEIRRIGGSETHGDRLVRRLRGRATTSMTTDELMELLRGE